MESGVYTFADMAPEPVAGRAYNTHGRITELMEEIKLADQVGLDVSPWANIIGPNMPAVILAAAAAVTSDIRLSSAVTVLSSDDPVRVFQSFATVDQLSGGRAEIMAGRESFIESYPLFGYNLNDYDALFAEKLGLLLRTNNTEHVTWQGKLRPSIDGLGVYPRPHQQSLPIWTAVVGTPTSAVRAATLKLPMALAIIGGFPERFVPFVDLYRETAISNGFENPPLSINSHVYVADSYNQAGQEFFPAYSAMMNHIGKERGWSPMGRADFEAMRSPKGSLVVGSPSEVIDKILFEHE